MYSHMYSWNFPSHLTMERLQLLLDYRVLEHGKCCGSPVLVSSHDISLWARTTMTCGNGCWTIKPCINELVIAWFYFFDDNIWTNQRSNEELISRIVNGINDICIRVYWPLGTLCLSLGYVWFIDFKLYALQAGH